MDMRGFLPAGKCFCLSQTNEQLQSTRASDGMQDEIDPEYEHRLVKKLDKHIIPVIMLLYLFSFLDRYVMSKKKENMRINSLVAS